METLKELFNIREEVDEIRVVALIYEEYIKYFEKCNAQERYIKQLEALLGKNQD